MYNGWTPHQQFPKFVLNTENLLLSLTEECYLGWLLVEDIFGAVLDLGVESGEVSDLLIISCRLLVKALLPKNPYM